MIQNKGIFIVQFMQRKQAPDRMQVDSPACNKFLSTSTTDRMQVDSLATNS